MLCDKFELEINQTIKEVKENTKKIDREMILCLK